MFAKKSGSMSCDRSLGARTVEHPGSKHPAPGYVRYQRPPVVEPIGPLVLDTGERLEGQIKYYDYGVLSVVFELPFSGDWETLVRMAADGLWDVDFESTPPASRAWRSWSGPPRR